MTGYNFESNTGGQLGIVDLKATNLHMSARPDTTCSVAGASAFGTLPFTGIPAGAIVTNGTVGGSVDVSEGTGAVLGVAIDARMSGDARPITYTWQGYVRLICAEALSVGDFIKPTTTQAYWGCAAKWADDHTAGSDSGSTASLAAQKLKFGKVLTATTAGGQTFEAYIDCSGV